MYFIFLALLNDSVDYSEFEKWQAAIPPGKATAETPLKVIVVCSATNGMDYKNNSGEFVDRTSNLAFILEIMVTKKIAGDKKAG